MNLVSARPPNANSFHSFVPTGNFHTSGSDPSMNRPFGMRSQRDFVAPSDQSGYWGLKERLPGATVFVAQSAYRPVSRSVGGGHDGCDWPRMTIGNATRTTRTGTAAHIHARTAARARPAARSQKLGYIEPFSKSGSRTTAAPRSNGQTSVELLVAVENSIKRARPMPAVATVPSGAVQPVRAPGPPVIHSRDMRQTLTTTLISLFGVLLLLPLGAGGQTAPSGADAHQL